MNNKKDYILYILIAVFLFSLGVLTCLLLTKESSSDKDVSSEEINDDWDKWDIKINYDSVNDSNILDDNIENNNQSNNTVNNDKNLNNKNVVETYSKKDTTIINTFENTLSEVNNQNNDKTFTESAKATFINIVDFLFYDGTINGITFKELTDKGKSKVLELATKIDAAIEKRIPGYKDAIAKGTNSAFNKASELIKKGANNLDGFLKSHLDEYDYNALIDAKDELILYSKNAVSFVGDVGSNLFNNAKDKLNNWYQNFKKENE